MKTDVDSKREGRGWPLPMTGRREAWGTIDRG